MRLVSPPLLGRRSLLQDGHGLFRLPGETQDVGKRHSCTREQREDIGRIRLAYYRPREALGFRQIPIPSHEASLRGMDLHLGDDVVIGARLLRNAQSLPGIGQALHIQQQQGQRGGRRGQIASLTDLPEVPHAAFVLSDSRLRVAEPLMNRAKPIAGQRPNSRAKIASVRLRLADSGQRSFPIAGERLREPHRSSRECLTQGMSLLICPRDQT